MRRFASSFDCFVFEGKREPVIISPRGRRVWPPLSPGRRYLSPQCERRRSSAPHALSGTMVAAKDRDIPGHVAATASIAVTAAAPMPSARARRIDALGVQIAQEFEQVGQRSAQSINRPSRNHVDLAQRNGLQQLMKTRTRPCHGRLL
jgi:hypothetical protein